MRPAEISDNDWRHLQNALRSGNKIEAIKIYRESTGKDLLESKSAVDKMVVEIPAVADAGQAAASVPRPASIPGAQWSRIRTELRTGNKIQAIKIYREFTGVGLKEAKDAVEALDVKVTPGKGDKFTPRTKIGCSGMILLLLASACLLSIFF